MPFVQALGRRMHSIRGQPAWAGYAGAAALVLAAFLLRLALEGVYPYPFATFIPAILAAALLFGHGSGLLATLLSATLATRFFAPPGGGVGGMGGADAALALGAFVAFGLLGAAAIEALGASVDRLGETNARLAEANRRLAEADRRKGLLLAEVNHRLKNSLHAAAGALGAEARRAGDAAAREALEDAAARLRALGRVHERLHVGADPSATRIDLRGFLEALCADFRAAAGGRDAAVVLHVEAEEVEADAARAATVGLIANEAVTNALRHAFPDGRSGTVSVGLRRCGGGWLRLEVADDGIGPGPGGPPRGGPDPGHEGRADGGTRLIGALARQLGGAAERHGPPGTRVVVRFPEEAPA